LYLICRSGSRGRQACAKFLAAGYTNISNVEGGTLACVECGLPVVRGKKTIALERQVRIAAGLLVVLGALLSWLIHPAFIGLAAFVGAGLVFSGVTDTCGMGLLLARMIRSSSASGVLRKGTVRIVPWSKVVPLAANLLCPASAGMPMKSCFAFRSLGLAGRCGRFRIGV
jgi:hypothetical protein